MGMSESRSVQKIARLYKYSRLSARMLSWRCSGDQQLAGGQQRRDTDGHRDQDAKIECEAARGEKRPNRERKPNEPENGIETGIAHVQIVADGASLGARCI